MKQSTKRLFSSFLALIFLILAFVVFFEFVEPAYTAALQAKGEELAREAFINNQQDSIKKVKNLIADYGEKGGAQEVLSNALPLTPDVAGAIAQINGIAAANGLITQSFSISVAADRNVSNISDSGSKAAKLVNPTGVITIQFRLTGTYEDFKNFVKELETNVRILDVRNLSFQGAAKANQNMYNFDLIVVTYYQNS